MTGPGAAPPPRRSWPAVVRAELLVVLALLAAGVVRGGVWALAAPGVSRAADPGESRIAVDGLLAMLQLGAGLVTAVALVVAPGRDRCEARTVIGTVTFRSDDIPGRCSTLTSRPARRTRSSCAADGRRTS